MKPEKRTISKLTVEASRAAMTDYLAKKKTLNQISQRYGLSPAAITVTAKKLGLPLRNRGRWRLKHPTTLHKKIITTAETKSGRYAAAKFGISKQRVSAIVHRWKGWRTAEKAKRQLPAKRSYVVSFRIARNSHDQLQRILVHPWFRHWSSPGDAARDILISFLTAMFPANECSVPPSANQTQNQIPE